MATPPQRLDPYARLRAEQTLITTRGKYKTQWLPLRIYSNYPHFTVSDLTIIVTRYELTASGSWQLCPNIRHTYTLDHALTQLHHHLSAGWEAAPKHPHTPTPAMPLTPAPLTPAPLIAPLTYDEWENLSDMAAIGCDWAFIVWAKGDLMSFCTVDEELWYSLSRTYVSSVIAQLLLQRPHGLPIDAWIALSRDLNLHTFSPTTSDYLIQFALFSELRY